MVTLRFDPAFSEQIPFLRLAGLLFTGVTCGPASAELRALIEAAAAQTALGIKLDEISALPGVAGWRRVMKALGTDPARYRVSSERLLRRAVKGDGLPAVNALVDICNVWSLVSGLPAGLYDADKLAGTALTFGAGRPGESYAALGGAGAGAPLETAGKPVLRDDAGPCGSPLTDSDRTRTDETTRRCLLVVYVPPGYPADELERNLALAADWYPRYAGGELAQQAIIDG